MDGTEVNFANGAIVPTILNIIFCKYTVSYKLTIVFIKQTRVGVQLERNFAS